MGMNELAIRIPSRAMQAILLNDTLTFDVSIAECLVTSAVFSLCCRHLTLPSTEGGQDAAHYSHSNHGVIMGNCTISTFTDPYWWAYFSPFACRMAGQKPMPPLYDGDGKPTVHHRRSPT